MNDRIITIVLSVGLLFSGLVLMPKIKDWRPVGIHTGYEPDQPIEFSHRLHAGELQVSCNYCHYGAEVSKHAGIPPLDVCMNCHRYVTVPFGAVIAEDKLAQEEEREPKRLVSPEIQKIYDALGLDKSLKYDSTKIQTPVEWTNIHNIPDFSYFDHRPHVAVGLACQKCHGPVETMERVRMTNALNMGWCVQCHRESNETGVNRKQVNAPLDCSACHY